MAAILDLCKWGLSGTASTCVPFSNHFSWPKVLLCQRKQFYYKVQRSLYMRCLNKSTTPENIEIISQQYITHDDAIKWKRFPRYWPFVRGIHRFPVNSPHKGQWRRALMISLICVWINGWVNNPEAGDLRRYCAHFDITVMINFTSALWRWWSNRTTDTFGW